MSPNAGCLPLVIEDPEVRILSVCIEEVRALLHEALPQERPALEVTINEVGRRLCDRVVRLVELSKGAAGEPGAPPPAHRVIAATRVRASRPASSVAAGRSPP